MDDETLNSQQQADNDALASAVGAAAHQLGLGGIEEQGPGHHFHHQLQQPDFSQGHKDVENHEDVDVHTLDIPVEGDDVTVMHGDEDLDLGLGSLGTPGHDSTGRGSFGRPPSIRKACDLCHAAKQKCSGDRPSCTRCAAGGWQCVYAPRQRRRTVPKEQRLAAAQLDVQRAHLSAMGSQASQVAKKRKLSSRESLGGFASEGMDMKMAMGMAMDMGLTGEEEGEEMLTMTDDQMLESIAIDGYLADLPLATFQHNLPYQAPPHGPETNFNADDFHAGADNAFPTGDMDQHTTSALRDAIFSLNESSGANATHGEVTGEGEHTEGHADGEQLDPHLALLDLSHAMPEGDNNGANDTSADDINVNLSSLTAGASCSHSPLVPHILALLTHHPLEPKPGSNTPLTLAIFAPLARSLRLWHALANCPHCSTSPHQTLPQLALLSRTTTILTFPFPPIVSSSVGSSAQITLHGARLSGTGLSEAIEQHIVGVVWDSWRAAVREIFASVERKAQEIITATAMALTQEGANLNSSPETQRAGLMFQAMSRLVTAMDEVEGN